MFRSIRNSARKSSPISAKWEKSTQSSAARTSSTNCSRRSRLKAKPVSEWLSASTGTLTKILQTDFIPGTSSEKRAKPK